MADEEDETNAVPEQSGGGMMKKIVWGGIATTLLVIGIVAGPTVRNIISPPPADDDQSTDSVVVDSRKPAIYQSLHPPLVINFKDSLGDSHFMQITLELMSRDQHVINAIQDHTPAIRNALILLFGTVEYDLVTTRDGKEKLLDDALVEVQGVLRERIGEAGVEEAYFTSLIIQ